METKFYVDGLSVYRLDIRGLYIYDIVLQVFERHPYPLEVDLGECTSMPPESALSYIIILMLATAAGIDLDGVLEEVKTNHLDHVR